MSDNHEELQAKADRFASEYEQKRELYADFSASVENLIKELLRQARVDYHRLESREKDADSLKGKILRPEKEGKYDKLEDVTDLAGVRVVSFLREECYQICEIIRNHFDVDEVNSVDKIEDADPDRFGYLSVHFVASYNSERIKLPEFSRYQDLKVEIQVRTILQHAWAVIDWRLRYKSAVEAPKPLRRRLFRISALLETADDQFSVLMQETEELRKSYAEEIKKGNLELLIDSESVGIFVDQNKNLRKFAELADNHGYHIEQTRRPSANPYVALLLTLRAAGLKSLEDVDAVLRQPKKNLQEMLDQVYSAWKTPDKPAKIVMPIHSLLRMLVILNSPSPRAQLILADYPFGAELQRAILQTISRAPA